MNKDRIVGSAKKFFGSFKQTAGKALGDKKTASDGHALKVEGKIQNAVGGAKDAIRETVKK